MEVIDRLFFIIFIKIIFLKLYNESICVIFVFEWENSISGYYYLFSFIIFLGVLIIFL